MVASRHIYVVDDDSLVRRSTVFTLATAGYSAQPFEGGRVFLDGLGGLEPGCVLLDVRMPEVDGFGVLQAMADRLEHFPVVVMTGHGDIATAVQSMKLGATDFLEKPFDDTLLFEILDRLGDRMAQASRKPGGQAEARRLLSSLSTRETEVLSGLTAGLANKEIAHRLSLSIRTVEMHRANLMEKLEVRTLADALRVAFRADLAGS